MVDWFAHGRTALSRPLEDALLGGHAAAAAPAAAANTNANKNAKASAGVSSTSDILEDGSNDDEIKDSPIEE